MSDCSSNSSFGCRVGVSESLRSNRARNKGYDYATHCTKTNDVMGKCNVQCLKDLGRVTSSQNSILKSVTG